MCLSVPPAWRAFAGIGTDASCWRRFAASAAFVYIELGVSRYTRTRGVSDAATITGTEYCVVLIQGPKTVFCRSSSAESAAESGAVFAPAGMGLFQTLQSANGRCAAAAGEAKT